MTSYIQPSYRTKLGKAYCEDSLKVLKDLPKNSINLVFTSPPFALQRQKEYGNKSQETYNDWLLHFAALVHSCLRDDGSFVLDLGGAYRKGIPVRSLYNFRLLIRMCDELGFHLAEDFYWYNPSKLPSPIEWVNKRKIRAKDSINTVWWFSKSEYPKADVRRVLTEYSNRMKKLLKDPEKYYQPKERPSGHRISNKFGQDNGGAIPSNLLQIPNSESSSHYLRCCRAVGIKPHPARFPAKLPEFFIKFLTDPGDLVVDIFSGSNTTGMVAEQELRRWISIEKDAKYTASSAFRFVDADETEQEIRVLYERILLGETVDMMGLDKQPKLL
ncbi:MAG: site-specific DNA-methyltransferase [Chloroflexi bacterium]|nr:site-specific DNA-methyltransferase [Chloroflexota bacterium]